MKYRRSLIFSSTKNSNERKKPIDLLIGNAPILISVIALVWSVFTYNLSYKRDFVKAKYTQKVTTYVKFLNACTIIKNQQKDSTETLAYKNDYSTMKSLLYGEFRLIADTTSWEKGLLFDLALRDYHQTSSTSDEWQNVNTTYTDLCDQLIMSLNHTKDE
jgi:hypothetical protein